MICVKDGNYMWIDSHNGKWSVKETLIIVRGWCIGGSHTYADVNGDKKTDIVCDDGKGAIKIAYGAGDGTFNVLHEQ